MTNHVKIFEKLGQEVRVILVDEQPWFVAADVCRMFGIKNSSYSITAIDSDCKRFLVKVGKDTYELETKGAPHQELNQVNTSKIEELNVQQPRFPFISSAPRITIINLSGLSQLVARSKNSEAKPFRDWIFNDVLTEVMEKGAYMDQDRYVDFIEKLYKRLENDPPEKMLEELDTILPVLGIASEKYDMYFEVYASLNNARMLINQLAEYIPLLKTPRHLLDETQCKKVDEYAAFKEKLLNKMVHPSIAALSSYLNGDAYDYEQYIETPPNQLPEALQ